MAFGHSNKRTNSVDRRHLTTHKITSQSAHERLTAQRRNRPIAPHMTIYKWQYVSSASALHRITGLLLSGSLYGLATAYLFVPALGLQFDWSDMVTAFGSLPTGVKAALKFGSSMPFTYHAFNGVKHLVWDSGHLLSKSQSGRASWAVLACSMSTSLGLALYQF